MVEYTAAEKLFEVERELAWRKRHYPGLVAKGSLSQITAERQMKVLIAIAEDYRTAVRNNEAAA